MENQEQTEEIIKLKENQKSMAEKIDVLTDLVKEEFSSLRTELKANYVSNDKFLPVKLLTYGFAIIPLLNILLEWARKIKG